LSDIEQIAESARILAASACRAPVLRSSGYVSSRLDAGDDPEELAIVLG
jgi:hypothetical protein